MEENKFTDDFEALYPDTNREELLADEDFGYFASGKLESESLSSVYGKYLSLLDKVRSAEREKVSAIFANRMYSDAKPAMQWVRPDTTLSIDSTG